MTTKISNSKKQTNSQSKPKVESPSKSQVRTQTKKQTNVSTTQKNKNEMKLIKEYSEVEISVGGETPRRAAFAFFNRDINFKNVETIFKIMQSKGYRKGEPIQVIKAEIAVEQGISEIRDINKNIIPKEQYQAFYLPLDGQHRTMAASLYNDWLLVQAMTPIKIPAIEIDLINDETIAEYISEKNCTVNNWGIEDFVKGAACVHSDQPLLKRYNELIKSASNPDGFSISTLGLIYCNGKNLTPKDLDMLCSGKLTKGKGQEDIIPAYNIEVGDRFISLCRRKKLNDREIRKRYLIKEFNNIRNSEGGISFAFKVFNSLTQNDIESMMNKNKKLMEDLVTKQFRIFKERVIKEQKTTSKSQMKSSK
jgi:hypothetical protein